MASSNWSYDVFPSFSGEDVRKTFLSHFLRDLEKKSIISFKDNKMKRGQSIAPELAQAIKDSRIAVIIFSKNYASSSWCLNELLEIQQCKKDLGQLVIPVFYGLDPSHLRKQSGDFGEAFKKTCRNQTEDVKNRWKQALRNVANILGYHSKNYDSEATLVEEISSDILGKLNLTPSSDFEDFVGIKYHIAAVRSWMHLESKEVRMVGIWGMSGIGKTTIARALFSNLSSEFQRSVFIDRAFVSKSIEAYGRANLVDCNMKLCLRQNFLSEILDKKNMKVGAMEERLKYQKVLIIIDDLDDQYVLEALAGQTKWFGSGSRILVVTTDRHILKAHGIDSIYEVRLPSDKLALDIFCRSAFKQDSPPDGLMNFASEVVKRAGNLPLGLSVLGSSLRGLNKEDCLNMLPRFQRSLDGKIEETLRFSYDGLGHKEDKSIFRHIACLFNYMETKDIKVLLADSEVDVEIGLKNLSDKSLIRVNKSLMDVREDTVVMHRLLQDMGKEIVLAQSNEPGKREFLVDSKDICDLLEDNNGTKKVLGISLDIGEITELRIHKEAFKGMCNLRFLTIYNSKRQLFAFEKKEWHLPEGFNYLPPKLILLRLYRYPMRCLPSNFCPENLVDLQMQGSKLVKLWDGVHSLSGLKNMDMSGSRNLKEIPDLSRASNLEKLNLGSCSSLVELPSSIQYLHKLIELKMSFCENLETLPTGVNLQSLRLLDLTFCYRLRSFPDISTNISDLYLGSCSSLVEVPSSIKYLNKLERLMMQNCRNLETLPTGINLQSLDCLDFSGCSRLKSFPDISTNISQLILRDSGIEEFPSNLQLGNLCLLDMYKLKSWKLWKILQPLKPLLTMFSPSLTRLELSDIPSLVKLPSSIQNFSKLEHLRITDCVNLETLPVGINLAHLYWLEICQCPRLRTFPGISTHMRTLYLNDTGVEEVPWWIKYFSNLRGLYMRGCNNLIRVSRNIYKLKHLKKEGCDLPQVKYVHF